MAVAHDESVAFHEAGHLIIGLRSGVAIPYEIFLETEHGQLDGHLGVNEKHDIPEAAQAVVRTAYAGPLAEMRRSAIDQLGMGTVFDLADVAADFLSAVGHNGQIRLRFVLDAEGDELTFPAAPFGTDINRVLSIMNQGHISKEQVIDQIRLVREKLNHPHVWAQVQKAVDLLLAAPTWQVTRKGFNTLTINEMLGHIDAVPLPNAAAG